MTILTTARLPGRGPFIFLRQRIAGKAIRLQERIGRRSDAILEALIVGLRREAEVTEYETARQEEP